MRDYVERLLERMPRHPSIYTRLVLMLAGVLVIFWISHQITGLAIPTEPHESLIFQGGLLLVVFGSLIFEDKFTKPIDGVVNALLVLISLIPSFATRASIFFYFITGYALLVLASGVLNVVLSRPESMKAWRTFVCDKSYKIATALGKSNVIFSFVFLYAVFSLERLSFNHGALLLCFWGFYIALWPLKIPHLFQALFTRTHSLNLEGTIVRVDVPDLVKVKLTKEGRWHGNLFASLGDGKKHRVLPLYTQIQDEEVIGTGLIREELAVADFRTASGSVYRIPSGISAKADSKNLVGIVTEGSRIARLCFETWKSMCLKEGMLVYCKVGEEIVYYQVSDALTTQEVFEKNRHGFQVVEAHQLGTFHSSEGFKKFAWLPEANTPIFAVDENIQKSELKLSMSEMSLGTIPSSDIEIVCDIDEMISHHTAILGVTGSGKTELAFRIIQQAIDNNVKVFCVDITGQYIEQLARFCPEELSIDEDLATKLGEKLHGVETGEYGGRQEKKILKNFTDRLRGDIDTKVSRFLEDSNSIGIFTMRSISNTKATIHATEIYLSSVFKHGRETAKDKQRILVVLEEAHTVIPEANTMGLSDYDSRGMVAKIAQIALQGRKYNVGLLVIAQRTATVSKTVLTQCNTMISFSSFDKTGLDFLSNVYGAEHTSKISNLRPFYALAFGKGIRSERPVVVKMPPLNESENEFENPSL